MKLWFFGDSFTHGDGCLNHYIYHHKYKKSIDGIYEKKIWVEYVAEYLDFPFENYSISGNSNPFIINQLINNMTKFKKGDIVFISMTFPERTILYNKKYSKIFPASSDLILSNHYTDYGKPKKKFNNIFFKNKDKLINAFINYLVELRLPSINVWNSYYTNQFINFKNYFDNLGIRVYIWSSYDEFKYKRYENIKECTNGNINDIHWSFKGHFDFANDVISDLNENKFNKLKLTKNI